jgi:hypothetical protein
MGGILQATFLRTGSRTRRHDPQPAKLPRGAEFQSDLCDVTLGTREERKAKMQTWIFATADPFIAAGRPML